MLSIFLPPILYVFIAIVYGRYIYRRHTWKFAMGDEAPCAVIFGIFWPVSVFVQFALFLGEFVHLKTPKKG